MSLATTFIAAELEPYLPGRPLTEQELEQVSTYLELLMRWNARINLTSVREPAEMLTRHFGESFFLATLLSAPTPPHDAVDVGSGAGFPGIPLKMLLPNVHTTLIESQNKKATFLKEVIRSLRLTKIDVFAGRAESWKMQAEVVTMRAVEKFDRVLPVAARLVRKPGRIALLVGASQVERARDLLPATKWESDAPVPRSRERVALIGRIS
jgi:16S rRNA (guanine527-N7)-methyltransferase